MNETLEQFKSLGMSASFHYADDSCREWGQAKIEELEAMQLYFRNPDLRPQMKEISKGFLWAYSAEKAMKEIDENDTE
jgi:hypothetical protein